MVDLKKKETEILPKHGLVEMVGTGGQSRTSRRGEGRLNGQSQRKGGGGKRGFFFSGWEQRKKRGLLDLVQHTPILGKGRSKGMGTYWGRKRERKTKGGGEGKAMRLVGNKRRRNKKT